MLAGPLVAGGVPAGTDVLSRVPGMEDAHWSYQRGLEDRTREEESQRSDAEVLARRTS